MKIFHPKDGQSLAAYLALEGEMVKCVAEPTLFTWVVPPTVIYGRHQVREQEVNEAFCAEHGIEIVQRQSGGGCVYADKGNLMVSYLEPTTSSDLRSQEPYEHFMMMLARALQQMGYEAVTTQHNDILVGGYKVAGTACYTTPTGTIVHACIAYDVCLDNMESALTPSAEKLQRHAVQSVRQRVCNLRTLKDLGQTEVFRTTLERVLMPSVVIFDLDGTLLNTIADLGEACNHALSACGYPTHRKEEYPQLVGNGVKKLIERSLPASERRTEIIERVATFFIPYYNAHNCEHTRAYEGIDALLSELKKRGCRLAVASNKYQAATEQIVAHYFPGVFDVVLGEREGIDRKPNPQIVYDILGSLRLSEDNIQTLYIGDSLVDKETATRAGVPFVACSWGFVSRDQLCESGVRNVIDTPSELLQYLSPEIIEADK